MAWRVLSNGLFLAGFLGLGLSAYLYFVAADAPGAWVDDPDREFHDLAVGANEVCFRLSNPTRHVVKVVGCSFC